MFQQVHLIAKLRGLFSLYLDCYMAYVVFSLDVVDDFVKNHVSIGLRFNFDMAS